MALRSGVPRTTHQWLKPLYNYLDAVFKGVVPSGASGVANGVWVGAGVRGTQLGNATGIIGFYGATGVLQPTGLGNTIGATGQSFYDTRSNGGSGVQFYTLTDVVAALKQAGYLAT